MEKINENFNNWLICITTIKFDLDIGQEIDDIYPINSISNSEEKILSLLSFPDSHSFTNSEGSIQYTIRLKINYLNSSIFSYGFVYFYQKKDPKISRGYFQKSLVILSISPFLDFYKTLINKFAMNYFHSENYKKCFEVLKYNNKK